MQKPNIICHMVMSIDGKVTGDFLSRPECESATDVYYELNRKYNQNGANGFLCGRVTMEGSFTGGWYPDLSEYSSIEAADFLPETRSASMRFVLIQRENSDGTAQPSSTRTRVTAVRKSLRS